MTAKIAWGLFVLVQVASWVVHRTAWMTTWWESAQRGLGVASVMLAVLLLSRGGFRKWVRIALVAVGLLVGQWFLWSRWLTVTVWRYRGFAP